MKRIPGLLGLLAAWTAACGNDNPPPYYGTQADLIGVGKACSAEADCFLPDAGVQHCLTEFKGGYCGLTGCATSADCPAGSGCVNYNGTTYCFRECAEKVDCNLNRPPGTESNCSSSVPFVDGKAGRKPCVPPSG